MNPVTNKDVLNEIVERRTFFNAISVQFGYFSGARQVLLPQFLRPADEALARGEVPGGSGEAEHGQRQIAVSPE